MMTGDGIRELFQTFFEKREHTRMPSASLVPSGDPTLLFTSAGMVPLKPFFMGEQKPPSRRLTSSQKSFRTTDIDEVGDNKHLTFFEMLGNFSIGDYFKKEAIGWAWEFVTSSEEGFGLSPDRFFATVYDDDDESLALWRDGVGLEAGRVYRYGSEDNWWGPAGREGPCGPCSELHYDFGADRGCGQPLRGPESEGEGCHPNHECERFVELWNLVFMQFYQDPDGNRTPLPAPSVDTGMGLERAAGIMQGTNNLYDTDLLKPLLEKASELSGKAAGQDRETDYALRVMAEHARAAAFLISDGVVPGNEGRGYVLRRVIRRAIRYGRRLGLADSFLTQVAQVAVARFGKAYPDLVANEGFILKVVGQEEEGFGETLVIGLPRIEALIEAVVGLNGTEAVTRLGNGSADLYDTFGIPLELVTEMAVEKGLENLDYVRLNQTYESAMEERRERARAARVTTGGMEIRTEYEGLGTGVVEFVGYSLLEQATEVAALLVNGEAVSHASQGQRVEVVLKVTPFYAEAGGQVGDVGVIAGTKGRVQVEDTQSPVAGLIIHKGVVSEGDLSLDDQVEARVDPGRRIDTARHHSGTHLLHASLRSVLGPHVRQAGSLVAPDHLRFDYTHVSPLDREELRDVQGLANQKVREDLEVSTHETTYAEAVGEGALAFFGDKYGDRVRVVAMVQPHEEKAFSLELCGGTHVHATGEVGPIFILGESSIGGGMRRVEAVTGRAAEDIFVERSDLLQSISRRLETPVVDLEARLESFMADVAHLRKRVEELERGNLRTEAQDLLSKVQQVDGVQVLAAKTSATNVEAMREMGDWLKAKLSSAVLVLAMTQNGSPLLISMVTPDLVKKGLHAGNIVRETAQILGGGGGGKAESAQAGGKRLGKLPQALEGVADIVRREVKP
jgi:alanyl-tRNA synthetase